MYFIFFHFIFVHIISYNGMVTAFDNGKIAIIKANFDRLNYDANLLYT